MEISVSLETLVYFYKASNNTKFIRFARGKKADLSLELLLTEFPAKWEHESQTFHRVIDNTIKRETGKRGGGGRAPLIAFPSPPQKKTYFLSRETMKQARIVDNNGEGNRIYRAMRLF